MIWNVRGRSSSHTPGPVRHADGHQNDLHPTAPPDVFTFDAFQRLLVPGCFRIEFSCAAGLLPGSAGPTTDWWAMAVAISSRAHHQRRTPRSKNNSTVAHGCPQPAGWPCRPGPGGTSSSPATPAPAPAGRRAQQADSNPAACTGISISRFDPSPGPMMYCRISATDGDQAGDEAAAGRVVPAHEDVDPRGEGQRQHSRRTIRAAAAAARLAGRQSSFSVGRRHRCRHGKLWRKRRHQGTDGMRCPARRFRRKVS